MLCSSSILDKDWSDKSFHQRVINIFQVRKPTSMAQLDAHLTGDQEQFSVSGDRMSTILVSRLGD